MRRKTLPCTEEEEEALLYFIIIPNLSFTHYPFQPLSFSFPNFMVAHGVGVAQAKPACKHMIATRKCYQYNTMPRLSSVIDIWGCIVYNHTNAILSGMFTFVILSVRIWHPWLGFSIDFSAQRCIYRHTLKARGCMSCEHVQYHTRGGR